ncbi:EmrB/QacA subfamily drug resistance transporter [Catenulispora sp. MAP5-51]|uniref:MFS transporter n=1 Tax=Catenulispora sp. MAP5-51 TaxID=3156298 RepID=UPI0035182F60
MDITDSVPNTSDASPPAPGRDRPAPADAVDAAPGSPAAPDARSPWVALTVVCVAQFMITLDATVVNVAAPAIQKSLHFAPGNLQWIINAYTLFSGGFLLLGGRTGDLVGRRRVFSAGVFLFTAASLLNGVAPNAGVLIFGRGLQGLGAAFASPAALAVLMTAFPGTRERTKALAVWSTIAVSGGAVGVLLGGMLTDLLSWRWTFFINLPIGVLTLLATTRFVPASRGEGRARGFDAAGAVSVTGGCVLLVYWIVQAPTWGWGSAKTLGVGAAALVILAAFGLIERRSSAPLVRFELFRVRAVSIGNGALFLFGGAAFALFFFASLYLQEVMAYSPLRAGVAFLPVFVSSVLGAGVAQQLVRRIGPRAVALLGLAVCVVGMLMLARIPVHGSYTHDLLVELILISLGMGIATVPLILLSTTGVREDLSGLASGVNNMSQNIGRALGLAILSSIATSHAANVLRGHPHATSAATAAQVSGYHWGFVGSAILILGSMAVVGGFLRGADLAALDETAAAPSAA